MFSAIFKPIWSTIWSSVWGAFSPLSLFAASEQGGWYDAEDMSTLFQDAAGTTPVTAVEQPVGLWLDKSRGLVLGANAVPQQSSTFAGVANGTNLTTLSGYAAYGAGATATVQSERGSLVTVAASTGIRYDNNDSANVTYKVTMDVFNTPINLFVESSAGTTIANITLPVGNSRSFYYTRTNGALTRIYFRANSNLAGGGTSEFDNFTIEALPGNHATQSTTLSRPVWSARYNLLQRTEQFDDAAWANTISGAALNPTVTADQGTAPDGTNTADRIQFSLGGGTTASDITRRRQAFTTPAVSHVFSVWLRSFDGVSTYNMHLVGADGGTTNVVVTGGWQRFQVVATGTGGSVSYAIGLRGGQSPANSNTADVLVWGAQLILAADQLSTGNRYQRVGNGAVGSADYDTTGFRHYLRFDGSDDSFGTGAIDFSATDKVTVFAGLTKLSDAAPGMVCELSSITSSTAGAFYMAAPLTTAANGSFAMYSRGSVQPTDAANFVDLAPKTAVLTGLRDIGVDQVALRLNGAQVATNSQDQGTGNGANAPLFIGSRNNASLRFNGRIYGLIVRGAQSGAGEIAATESWLNQRTGAY